MLSLLSAAASPFVLRQSVCTNKFGAFYYSCGKNTRHFTSRAHFDWLLKKNTQSRTLKVGPPNAHGSLAQWKKCAPRLCINGECSSERIDINFVLFDQRKRATQGRRVKSHRNNEILNRDLRTKVFHINDKEFKFRNWNQRIIPVICLFHCKRGCAFNNLISGGAESKNIQKAALIQLAVAILCSGVK